MGVVTTAFENLARTAGRARGWPDVRLLVLPHPLEPLPEAELRALATGHADGIRTLLAEEP